MAQRLPGDPAYVQTPPVDPFQSVAFFSCSLRIAHPLLLSGSFEDSAEGGDYGFSRRDTYTSDGSGVDLVDPNGYSQSHPLSRLQTATFSDLEVSAWKDARRSRFRV
jgi:hypothetical protein